MNAPNAVIIRKKNPDVARAIACRMAGMVGRTFCVRRDQWGYAVCPQRTDLPAAVVNSYVRLATALDAVGGTQN